MMMSDKAPFLVTVILGVLGWLVSHMVDRIVGTPTLEYHVEKVDEAGRRGLTVELVNVTRTKSFEGLEARIVIPGATAYDAPTMTTAQPTFEGTIGPSTTGATTVFTLPTMMPGSSVTFGVTARSEREPALRISSAGATPIRLQPRGLETFFARNEISILLALFLLWLAALLALGGWTLRRRRGEAQPAAAAVAPDPRPQVVEIRVMGAAVQASEAQVADPSPPRPNGQGGS